MMCSLALLYGDDAAGDEAAEVGLFPLEHPPADMAFETDRKTIESLKAGRA